MASKNFPRFVKIDGRTYQAPRVEDMERYAVMGRKCRTALGRLVQAARYAHVSDDVPGAETKERELQMAIDWGSYIYRLAKVPNHAPNKASAGNLVLAWKARGLTINQGDATEATPLTEEEHGPK